MSINSTQYVVMVNHDGYKSTQKFDLTEGECIVIGRSWKNDVVINDEFIDAEHLKLTTDNIGTLYVEDLGSTNGTRIGKRQLKTAVNYPKGMQLGLGDSIISIIDVDTSVTPAVQRDSVYKLSRRFQSIVWYVISTLAAALALVGGSAIYATEQINSQSIVEILAGGAVIALAVACVGGILSMLFRRNTLFGLHYIFYCWAMVLFAALDIIWEIIAFNIDHSFINGILENVVQGGFLFILLYGALSMTTRISRHKKLPLAALVVLAPIVFSYVKTSLMPEHEAWSSYAQAGSVNQPPVFNFNKGTTIESHVENVDKLFAGLIDEVTTGTNEEHHSDTIQISESAED